MDGTILHSITWDEEKILKKYELIADLFFKFA